MHKIGFGVVGAGLIAPFHSKAIRDSDEGQTIGIFDVDNAKAKKLASEFNARTYASLTEMLEDDRINTICVATPNHLHKDTCSYADFS